MKFVRSVTLRSPFRAIRTFSLAVALILPGLAIDEASAQIVFFDDLAQWQTAAEDAHGSSELFETSAANLALSSQLVTPPATTASLAEELSFPAQTTGLCGGSKPTISM